MTLFFINSYTVKKHEEVEVGLHTRFSTCELLISFPDHRFTPDAVTPGYHRIGRCVGPRAVLDAV
jgi:hypothetical protein